MDADNIISELQSKSAAGWPLPRLKELAIARLHESNPRFHWTGIYDLFPDDTLRLGPFLGAPTDHVFIGMGQGVCGTAIAERRNINVPDVTQVENYLACSTETRSELVVLIRTGERIHGQIDIDSHEPAAFDETAEQEVQKIADFLAPLYEAWTKGRVS